MRIERLHIERLRIVESAELHPGPRLNLITGPNGAGKTSVLEALHLLAYGRSFRSPTRDVLIRRPHGDFAVFAEVRASPDSVPHRLGLQCTARGWQAKVDGENVPTLGELLTHCPVVCFEPGSHALIAGPSDLRRRYLDWGLFHVEQAFPPIWRRYHRALKQRNALLKSGQPTEALDAWDSELVDAGEQLHALRLEYARQLSQHLIAIATVLMPEAGEPCLDYIAGWRVDRESLSVATLAARDRDLATGHTNVGPHRANWTLTYPALPQRESFSRGQEKLTALICAIAQARHFSEVRGHWPIIALDDLGSELDAPHQESAIQCVSETGAQAWITGTATPAGLSGLASGPVTFHVEQGNIHRAL